MWTAIYWRPCFEVQWLSFMVDTKAIPAACSQTGIRDIAEIERISIKKESLRSKRLKVAWNKDFLINLLKI
jgi:hypothetical protein